VQLGLVCADAKIAIDALFVAFGKERHTWRRMTLLLVKFTGLVLELRVLLLLVVPAARDFAWRG
jgi:hypothetical protein